MIYKKLLLGIAIATLTLQTQCGSAATQLANIDPVNGGSISLPGSYYLGYDIGNTTQFATITIAASDVILDLNGHLVTGMIAVNGDLNNVTITNGIIQQNKASTTAALNVLSGNNNLELTMLTIRNQTGAPVTNPGIRIAESTNIVARELFCYGSSSSVNGLYLTGCNNADISNCVFSGWNDGFAVGSSKNVVITECSSNTNNNNGFFIDDLCSQIIFLDCIAFSNAASGFLTISTATDLNFEAYNCIADSNAANGFGVFGSSVLGSSVLGILEECFSQNNRFGFRLQGSNTRFMLKECTALANTTQGFTDNEGATSVAQYVASFSAYNGPVDLSGADNSANDYSESGDPFNARAANDTGTGGEFAQYWRNVFAPRECQT